MGVDSQATGMQHLPPKTRTKRVVRRDRTRRRYSYGDVIRFVALCFGGIWMLLPLAWMITVALKSNAEVFAIPPVWWPNQFHWQNFIAGTEQINFWRVFLNSVIIAALHTVGAVGSSVIVGYGISRIRFPGRKLWFYLFIGSMMLPGVIGMIPMFHLYASIGWYNTWLPLIVPAFFGNPFFMFLARQYFSTISSSYDEAAKIDGANHWQILTKILVPMSKPMIVTMVIFAFRGSWNDYLGPLIYLVNPKLWTLSVAMATYIGSYYTPWNLFMAADLIYMLPMVVVFFVAQKYFMQGLGTLNASGLK